MTVSIVNNKTQQPNEAIADDAYNRLCHALVTLESAVRHVKVNACRIAEPTTDQQSAIHNYIIAIVKELADAHDELTHHTKQRQNPQTTKHDHETDTTLRQLNLE